MGLEQLLTIMSSTIAYLTSKADFMQVSGDIPVTKKRNADKVDSAEAFEGALRFSFCSLLTDHQRLTYSAALDRIGSYG